MFPLVAINSIIYAGDFAPSEERPVNVNRVNEWTATTAIFGHDAFLAQCKALNSHEMFTSRETTVQPKPIVG